MEMRVDQITYAIRGCAFDVYNQLGPGLREVVYQRALASQLHRNGWQCEMEKEVDIRLDGRVITKQKLDLLVEEQIIVEIKAEKELLPLDEAQIISYLKITGFKLGLLINFGSRPIQIRRFIN